MYTYYKGIRLKTYVILTYRRKSLGYRMFRKRTACRATVFTVSARRISFFLYDYRSQGLLRFLFLFSHQERRVESPLALV